MQFVDTNVLLRYLTGDDSEQSPKAFEYFQRVQGNVIDAMLFEGVIVEAIQVLESRRYFASQRDTIAFGMKSIIGLPRLHIHDRDRHLQALDIYAESMIDYVDCLLIAAARNEGTGQIASFDRDFDRFDDIVRVEP